MLQDEARSKCETQLEGDLKLKVSYTRSKGKADGANIIGGIADCLQHIVYKNDKSLVNISYSETRGEEDKYEVEISSIE